MAPVIGNNRLRSKALKNKAVCAFGGGLFAALRENRLYFPVKTGNRPRRRRPGIGRCSTASSRHLASTGPAAWPLPPLRGTSPAQARGRKIRGMLERFDLDG